MITDYFMITETNNRLQVIIIRDYDYPISGTVHEIDLLTVSTRFLNQVMDCRCTGSQAIFNPNFRTLAVLHGDSV